MNNDAYPIATMTLESCLTDGKEITIETNGPDFKLLFTPSKTGYVFEFGMQQLQDLLIALAHGGLINFPPRHQLAISKHPVPATKIMLKNWRDAVIWDILLNQHEVDVLFDMVASALADHAGW